MTRDHTLRHSLVRYATGLALVIGAPVVGQRLSESAGAAASASAPQAERPANASNDEAEAETEDFAAVLITPQTANLSPLTDSKVLAVRAPVGSFVKKGEVIVAFDLRDLHQRLAMAEAELRVARADANSADAEVGAARSRAARRDAKISVAGKDLNLVSDEELAQAGWDLTMASARTQSAQSRVAEQQAHVAELQLAVREGELRAPFDGVVAALNFDTGMSAHPGDTVARVVGGLGLRVRIAVPDDRASELKARRARIDIGGKKLWADIEQVSPEPDSAAHVFLVEGKLENTGACAGQVCAEFAGRAVRAKLVAP